MSNTRDVKPFEPQQNFLGIPMPWAMTIMAALSMVAFATVFYSFGVFFKPMANEFGWSRSAVSITVLIRSLTGAVIVAPAGVLTDKYGPRWTVMPAMVLMAICFVLTGKITAIWHLYLVQGFFMGIAAGTPWVMTVATVSKWHTKRAGLAMGITAVGAAVGAVIFPSLSGILIDAMGWRDAWMVLGVIVVCLGVPTSLFLRNPAKPKSKPEEIPEHVRRTNPFAIWKQIIPYLRQPAFLSMAVMFFFFAFAVNLILNHFVNYATDLHVAAVTAASMVSVIGLSSLSGRLLMGILSDRLGVRNSLVICFAVTLVGIVLMAWSASTAMMWVSVAIFGLGQGGEIPLVPGAVGERYGKERLASISGMVSMFMGIAGATGPYLGGAIFDWTGGYRWAFAVLIVMLVASLVVVMRTSKPSSTVQRQG